MIDVMIYIEPIIEINKKQRYKKCVDGEQLRALSIHLEVALFGCCKD